MSLVVSGTPLIVVLVAAIATIATIVTAVVRLKMLNHALKDTQPQERPEIIHALRGLWKSEWQFGRLRRTGPDANEATDDGEPCSQLTDTK